MPAPKQALLWWDAWNTKHSKTEQIDPAKMERVRLKCQTDHAFLAKCLGYMDFDPDVHGEVWKFYLQKNPSIPFKTFAAADKSTHDRALFLPRNCFKSTSNMIDMVQFIICWPNIRILLVTSIEDLGKKLLSEVMAHFKRQKDGEPRLINDEHSLFQLAFPEFCLQGMTPLTTFTVPCRTEFSKEATVEFAGVETAQSGVRADVLIFDDAVSNDNCRNPERLIKVRTQMAFHRKVMNPDGYCTYIGTWYSPQDAYGFIIRAEETNHTLFWDVTHRRAESRDTEGRKCLTKILLRPAMWEKEEKSLTFDGELNESDWTLFFPARVHWKWLMTELLKDPENFHSQLMNNPNMSQSVRFNRTILTRQTRLFTEIPDIRGGNGLLVQAWDTAYSDSTLANYTVGLTALILGGRYYFVDMIRGQFSDFDISRVMAENMAKWKPARVVLEESLGVRYLAREIYREFNRMNFYTQIEFSQIENKKNRKSIMAAPVAKLFSEGRIILSNTLPYLDKIYEELEGFQNGAPNDDIVDAMGLVVKHFQYVPEASHMALKSDVQEEMDRRRNMTLYRHFYGLNTGDEGFANLSDAVSGEDLPSWVTYTPYDAFRN